jgi:hypothetical protein
MMGFFQTWALLPGRYVSLRVAAGLVCAILILGVSVTAAGRSARRFSSGRARFSLKFNGEVTPYRVTGVFALPGERIPLEPIDPTRRPGRYSLRPGPIDRVDIQGNAWILTAPEETGLFEVRVVSHSVKDSITLNIFVMTPFEEMEGEYVGGYRIGNYPESAVLDSVSYDPPRGFIEVKRKYRDVHVTPHFTLGQFLCKQARDCTPYVVLSERLLLKLEFILERVNELGHRCDTFFIMSGYRTPFYNEAIGNVAYSRHLWGDAADIFIDFDPADGIMDDLNGDASIDLDDALVLYGIIDDLCGESWFEPFTGGLGKYGPNNLHGPFVHVDVRGCKARW